MKISGIYAIVNTVNGKRYVGSSQEIDYRFRKHKSALRSNRHHNPHLQSAWNKYGESCFDFIILEECEEELLLKREQAYLDVGCEYNIAVVAGSPMKGRKASEETLKKMSDARRGKPTGRKGMKASQETREKLSKSLKGRPSPTKGMKLSDETKKKIAEASRGRLLSAEAKQKISKANKGSKRTEEVKKKFSEIQLSRPPVEDSFREKMSEVYNRMTDEKKAARLRRISETKQSYSPERKAEMRRRMSDAQKRRWAEKRVECKRGA